MCLLDFNIGIVDGLALKIIKVQTLLFLDMQMEFCQQILQSFTENLLCLVMVLIRYAFLKGDRHDYEPQSYSIPPPATLYWRYDFFFYIYLLITNLNIFLCCIPDTQKQAGE